VAVGISSALRNGKTFGALVLAASAVSAVALVAIQDDSKAISIASVEVGADGRTLRVALNSCHADPEVTVRESESAVVIDVTGTPKPNDCSDRVTVRLDEPLGDRPIVDRATDRAVAVDPPAAR
jgi:hypothetical protein